MSVRWLPPWVALAVLAPLALLACEPERTPATPLYKCRARFVIPYRPEIISGRRVTGEAGFACRVPPAAHRAFLYLELQAPSGSWQIKDETSSTRIPDATGFTVRVIDDCGIGSWRMRITVQTTGTDGKVDRGGDHSDILRVRTHSQCDKVER